ncbi:glycosyltransferase [Chryseobacterium sp. R2A-55]|uniref:glycosyltransferase n=1 Tax=Chryseobacterium sp. R2A-55 TaxID=2744445 RepID=UPI001F383905|nr:glycosyltransferase [Chryseobacterium sp. R2A-55]
MRVLHVINSLRMGGAEKLIAETFPKLAKAGIMVDLLLLHQEETPLLHELRELNCCKIFQTDAKSVYSLRNVTWIMRHLKNYDVVHAHLFPSTYFLALAKRISFSPIPIIFTEHSTSNRRFRNKRLKWLNKGFYQIFQKIICITEEVKSAVQNHVGISDEKLEVIHNGINIEKFDQALPMDRANVDPGLKDSDFLLVQVSSFRPQKDQATVIRSLELLPEHVKLMLVGDGDLKKEQMELAAELNLGNRVFFLGNRSDVPSLLKTADAVVLSSNYEGFGLAIVEGMASGRPSIASEVPGLAEVVEGYGILFPKGDASVLANEVSRLMNDRAYYEETAKEGLERAKQFDITLMVEKTVQLYRELLKMQVNSPTEIRE